MADHSCAKAISMRENSDSKNVVLLKNPNVLVFRVMELSTDLVMKLNACPDADTLASNDVDRVVIEDTDKLCVISTLLDVVL